MTELSEHKIEITIALFLLGGILAWVFIPISVQEDTIIFLTESGGTPTPCSGNLGLILAQNLTDLCDVVIITPINTQVLQYNGTYWVNANVTVVDNTICVNVGGGVEVFKNGECNFRTLVGSSDIDIIQNTDTIVIDYNGTANTTVCNNVGVGTGLICRGGNVDIKSLIQGSGITITNNADDITITNASPDNTACFNVGSGLGVYKGGECSFNSLIAGTGITITDTTNDLTITNVGVTSLSSDDTASLSFNSSTGDITASPKLKKLCESTASGGETSLTCTLSSSQQFLQIQIYISTSDTATIYRMQFNADNGNNYSFRTSTNGGADATTVSTNGLILIPSGTASSQPVHTWAQCENWNSGIEKQCWSYRSTGISGASNAPSRVEQVLKWANTTDNITSIVIARTSGTGVLDAGNSVIVWGFS